MVQELLGLTVVGLEPNTKWFTLTQLVALARGRKLSKLLGIHLRVYGPQDFHQRCRQYFEAKGCFLEIPGGDAQRASDLVSAEENDLVTRIQMAAIKQVELAEVMGVSQPWVSQLVNGVGRWPEGALERVEALIRERLAQT